MGMNKVNHTITAYSKEKEVSLVLHFATKQEASERNPGLIINDYTL